MTLAPSDSGDDELIAQFMQELQASPNPDRVVEEFCARHPARAADFRAIAAAHRRLNAAAPEPAEAPPRLTPGEMLGDFRVVRFLTHGGMGEIYEAEQVCLSRRRVALKVIRHGKVSPDARARFLREQEVLARLHQTNIVPVFAAGEREELQYFAMQYIDGATLGHVVRFLRTHRSRNGGSGQTPSLANLVESVVRSHRPAVSADASTAPRSTAEADAGAAPGGPPVLTDEYCRSVAASLADVAEALDAAHRANVLHRDVKPSNLMAEPSGKCWVIDFGLAGLVGEASKPTAAGTEGPDPALTATGAAMGTYAYMAPEQFDGDSGPWSDVWALGATLYELLALRRPFDGPYREDYRRQASQTEPPRLRTAARHVPRDLDAICRKAMRKEPPDRYPNAGDFAADLRHWLRSEPTVADPPWIGRRVVMWARRNPGLAAMTAVACLALVSVTGLLLLGERWRTEAAQATAAREAEKAAAAEREVRQRDRQLEMLAFQRERLSPRTTGWRDRLWTRGVLLASDGADADLRDQMAALLAGLDAKHAPEFDEGSATFLAFDPSGRRLLMGGYKGSTRNGIPGSSEPTRVRDLSTGKVRRSSQAAVGSVGWRGLMPVQLVPPTRERSSFLLWNVDLDMPVEEFALPGGHTAELPDRIEGMNLAGAVLSADAMHVAALTRGAKDEGLVLIWRAGERQPWATIPVATKVEREHPASLVLAPDGSLVAVGGPDGRIRTWSLRGPPTCFFDSILDNDHVTGLAIGRDRHQRVEAGQNLGPGEGCLLAAGSAAGTVAVWDLGNGSQLIRKHELQNEVFGLGFSPDGVTLATAGRYLANLWDVTTGRRLLTLFSPDKYRNWLPAVAFSPDGLAVATASTPQFDAQDRGHVDLYRVEPSRGVHVLRGLVGPIRHVTVTPDGRRAAAISQTWQAGVWDVPTGRLLHRSDVPRAMYVDHAGICLSDDGKTLIVVGGTEARRWELPDSPDSPPGPVHRWSLNPASSTAVGITSDGRIFVCRAETVSGRAFPSGDVSPAADPRCVRIYDLRLGERKPQQVASHEDLRHRIFAVHGAAHGMCFITDGLSSVKAEDHYVIAYDGSTGKELWRRRFPLANPKNGIIWLECSGRTVRYAPENGKPNKYLAVPEWTDLNLSLRDDEEVISPGRYHARPGNPGARLCLPGAQTDFLQVSIDEPRTSPSYVSAMDGRFFLWGSDAAVSVVDLPRVREQLVSAGFPGW